MPCLPLADILSLVEQMMPAAPMSLHADHRAGGDHRGWLEQQFFGERITDPCTDGRSSAESSCRSPEAKVAPMDAVLARGGTDDVHRVTDAMGSSGRSSCRLPRCPPTWRSRAVDAVAVVEEEFTADCRYAEGVAVVADAFHDAAQEPVGPVERQVTEAQAVELRHRAGAHGKDVAVDAAHTRRRPGRFDGGRMVVRSISKAQASPSPMVTRPAFSAPACTSTLRTVFGSVLSQTMEFLWSGVRSTSPSRY